MPDVSATESARIETPPPRVMFIPVSGPSGMGELQRCLIIAAEAARRWPSLVVSFVVHRHVADVIPARYRLYALDDRPTRRTKAVVAALHEFRPGVAVFDGAARVAQLRAARRLGSRTVFVSSRLSGRRKLFRWRRLRQLDEGWFAQPGFLEPALGARERFKALCAGQPALRRLGPIFEPPDAARRGALLAQMALEESRYLVFCAGGGGGDQPRRVATEAFLGAAAKLGDAAGLRSVVLTGRGPAVAAPTSRVVALERLAHGEVIDLLSAARLAITNGGSLLCQAAALGTVCIAVPVTRDQPKRIAAFARRGLAIAGVADAEALANAALALLASETQWQQLRERLAGANLTNGLGPAVDALAGLLAQAGSETGRIDSRDVRSQIV